MVDSYADNKSRDKLDIAYHHEESNLTLITSRQTV